MRRDSARGAANHGIRSVTVGAIEGGLRLRRQLGRGPLGTIPRAGNYSETRQPNLKDAKASPANLPLRDLSPGVPIPGFSTPGVSPESRTRGVFFVSAPYRPFCRATPATARVPVPDPGVPVRRTVSTVCLQAP